MLSKKSIITLQHGKLICLLFIIINFSCNEKSNQALLPPFAPKQTIDLFEIADGFKIELVASEPLIADPVAMDALILF
jgi:hypothetical protein